MNERQFENHWARSQQWKIMQGKMSLSLLLDWSIKKYKKEINPPRAERNLCSLNFVKSSNPLEFLQYLY